MLPDREVLFLGSRRFRLRRGTFRGQSPWGHNAPRLSGGVPKPPWRGAFASRRGGARFRLAARYFERAKVPKAPLGLNAPNPVAEGKKNLLSLKAANSHLWWSGVAFVVFMIVWWLNRLPVISCSNSAAFFTAEQIFLKAWEASISSFTIRGYRNHELYICLKRFYNKHEI